MSHAEDLRDVAAWLHVHQPAMGNAPPALEAAAVDIVQGAGMLRATAFLLRERADIHSGSVLGAFLVARAADIETVANRLDPPREES